MFKKYNSIENHYRQKEINYYLVKFPELKHETFILEEKIDGSNFQVFINKYMIAFGKRSGFLREDESFFNWQNVMAKYRPYFEKIQKENETILSGGSIRFFGEIFGPGVQKRVEYGNEKDFKIFDMQVNDAFVSPKVRIEFLENLRMDHMSVPVIAIVEGLDAALNHNEVFNSLLTPAEYKKENLSEGFVIKPYDKVYAKENNEVFFLKKKNEKFSENEVDEKPKQEVLSKEDKSLNYLFLTYLNENRVLSVFSKEGVIKDKKEIGKFINLVLNDAKEDFIKDHGDKLNDLDDKQKHAVFNTNSGKVILPFLMKNI